MKLAVLSLFVLLYSIPLHTQVGSVFLSTEAHLGSEPMDSSSRTPEPEYYVLVIDSTWHDEAFNVEAITPIRHFITETANSQLTDSNTSTDDDEGWLGRLGLSFPLISDDNGTKLILDAHGVEQIGNIWFLTGNRLYGTAKIVFGEKNPDNSRVDAFKEIFLDNLSSGYGSVRAHFITHLFGGVDLVAGAWGSGALKSFQIPDTNRSSDTEVKFNEEDYNTFGWGFGAEIAVAIDIAPVAVFGYYDSHYLTGINQELLAQRFSATDVPTDFKSYRFGLSLETKKLIDEDTPVTVELTFIVPAQANERLHNDGTPTITSLRTSLTRRFKL